MGMNGGHRILGNLKNVRLFKVKINILFSINYIHFIIIFIDFNGI